MANPALNEKTLGKIRDLATEGEMTIEGTINRSGLLILIAICGAAIGWNMGSIAFLFVGFLLTFALSLFIIFKPHTAAYLSQPYAFAEGLLLGSISAFYAFKYPGIVSNALIGTMTCFMVMLGLYKFRVIRVTEKFRTVMIAATAAIALTYLVNMVMGFFGTNIPMIHQSSPMGIAFSVVVVGIAALNLLMDFDMIEQAHLNRAPKYMEWYCAFALLLTIVWLYLEILRLLSKLNKK